MTGTRFHVNVLWHKSLSAGQWVLFNSSLTLSSHLAASLSNVFYHFWLAKRLHPSWWMMIWLPHQDLTKEALWQEDWCLTSHTLLLTCPASTCHIVSGPFLADSGQSKISVQQTSTVGVFETIQLQLQYRSNNDTHYLGVHANQIQQWSLRAPLGY